jgi:hypothetical protein
MIPFFYWYFNLYENALSGVDVFEVDLWDTKCLA